MMRRAILCIVLIFAGTCAYAEVEEFRYFSLNVPDGWSANESGDVVNVEADDKSGSLTITCGNPRGESIQVLAEKFSREMKGSEPMSDDEGDYIFELNNGISQARITGDEDFYMMIVASGFVSNAETLGEIVGSLEMK